MSEANQGQDAAVEQAPVEIKQEKVTYVSAEEPSLKLTLKTPEGNIKVKFENKTLILDLSNPQHVLANAALEELLDPVSGRENIRRLVKKIDLQRALRIAQEDRARRARPNAVKGGLSATAISASKSAQIEAEARQSMLAAGVPKGDVEKAIAQLGEQGLAIATTGDQPMSTPSDGVTMLPKSPVGLQPKIKSPLGKPQPIAQRRGVR